LLLNDKHSNYLNLAIKTIEFERKVRIVCTAATEQNGATLTEGKNYDESY
jgi:hypothetical protein